MTRPRAVGFIAALMLSLLTACGDGQAPAGRWEGFSASGEWLVAARLQVDPGNTIHATALSVNVGGISLPRRLELTSKIKATLIAQWPKAVVGKVDYKDRTITHAGGVAPLFTFDPKSGSMTFYFYAGGKLTEKIRLYPVAHFSSRA
ncbi:MAG: hypothetical protein K8S25_10245 [Alphaproteobacteria bacterium]|nr:hypothetical protein [Alphaproteobacteria bacterium]